MENKSNNVDKLVQKLNSAELDSRKKSEEALKLSEKIKSLEFQLNNTIVQESQRKEEVMVKERQI